MGGPLQTRTMLAPFGHEEVKVVHGEEEDQSAGRLVVPKLPDGATSEEQGPSSSGKNPRRDDGQGGSRRLEEPMHQEDETGQQGDIGENEKDKGGFQKLDESRPLS